ELVGGCGTSEALIPELPEFTFNPGAVELLGFDEQPVYRDFQLERHGLELIENDPFFFIPFDDGTHIAIHRSVEKTMESIAAMSSADAEAYRRYVDFWLKLDEFVGPFSTRPAPLPGRAPRLRDWRGAAETLRVAARAARSPAVADIARFALMPARNYILEHF